MTVIDDLKLAANTKLANARELIGTPGPGIDIVITPTEPLSGMWNLEPKTDAGSRFIKLYWACGINSNHSLAEFKRQTADWGLSIHTDWGHIVDQRID